MNKFGLTPKNSKILKDILKTHPQITEVVIFGSRASKTNKPGSDVDMALKGRITLQIIHALQSRLSDSTLPYLFDIVDYRKITNMELKNNIDSTGGVFYRKA